MNNVYITGYTSISALGIGNTETLSALKNNQRNIYLPSATDKFKLPYFMVDRITSNKNIHTKCAEMVLALLEQIEDTWLKLPVIPLYIATSTGGINETEAVYLDIIRNSKKYPLEEKFFFYDIYETIKSRYKDKIGKVCSLFTSACSSAGHSLYHAFRCIRHGVNTKALVIGVDALSLTTLIGFNSLKLVSINGTKPLTLERDGLSLGEGGGVVLLEAEPSLPPVARILGIYSNTDGYHLTAPNPSGAQQAECIIEILKQAGVEASEIDYINAHGTGTPLNDDIEMKLIKSLFKKTVVSSLKGFTGHTLGSSALTELCITLEMLKDNKIYVPENLGNPMEPDYIPSHSLEKKVRYFIKNSFGFGGNNVSFLVENLRAE